LDGEVVMQTWMLGAVLTAALTGGFVAGWFGMRRLRIRMPNAWVSFGVLLAGSLGAPALTFHLLGPTPFSFTTALLAAGFSAGATFWPMGQEQGTREWL
jgi:hypothetical protein